MLWLGVVDAMQRERLLMRRLSVADHRHVCEPADVGARVHERGAVYRGGAAGGYSAF